MPNMLQTRTPPADAIHGVSHQPVHTALPPGSCDCHTHVFGPSAHYPLSANRKYTPDQASLKDMLRLHDQLGIGRVVIVHPSPYGSDNRCTIDALLALGERGRGVAVIDETTDDTQLKAMHDAGVRGVRVNLETDGIHDPAMATRQLLWTHDRVKDLGWHVQIYTNLAVFASFEYVLDQLTQPVVLDHFCGAKAALWPDQAHFETMLQRVRSGQVWVKLSAPHRISNAPDCADVGVMVQALLAANPDRLLWGSDWPHPGGTPGTPRQRDMVETFNPIDDGRAVNRLTEWIRDPIMLKKILVDNPAKLYDFKVD
jgi:predicted TIM-barrel fold metal-dependent hydrolase